MSSPKSPMAVIAVKSIKHPEVQRLAHREPSPSPEITASVQSILKQVRSGGQAAVLELARRRSATS